MNLEKQILQLAKDGRWYQDIPFVGVQVPMSYPEQKNSQFFGLNKWNNFIEPLLPFKDFGTRRFLEIGCNAGLYLLKAIELGFKTVVGIEADEAFYEQALFTCDYFGLKDVQLLRQVIGETEPNVNANGAEHFSIKETLVTDIVLLANVLYWLTDDASHQLIKDLSYKILYAIVVTVEDATGLSSGSSDFVKKLFSDDWVLVKVCRISEKFDPMPRQQIALLFKSVHLKEFDLHELWKIAANPNKEEPHREQFFRCFTEFVHLVFKDEDPFESDYFRYLIDKGGIGEWKTDNQIKRYVVETAAICKSIRNDGLKEPIQFFGHACNPINGYHRLVILRELGYRKILCQVGVEEIR